MKKLLLACAIGALSFNTLADNGFYAGASIGRSYVEDTEPMGTGETMDKNSTSGKLQLGYQVNQNFAIEGGYVDIGKATYRYVNGANHDQVDYTVKGIDLFAVGILPINNDFSVFGKIGGAYAQTKASGRYITGGTSVAVSAKNTEFEAAVGIGASYRFTRELSARVEYERYFDVGGDKTGTSDINIFSAGLTYAF